MHTPYLDRARRLRRGSPRLLRWLAATLSAAVLAAAALLLGVTVHKLVARDAGAGVEVRLPADPLLGGLLRSEAVQVTRLGEVCLGMAALGLLLWLLWQLMTRNGQFEAQEAISRLRRELYAKAITLGSTDVLGDSAAEHLFLRRCEPLRHGLAVIWQQGPRCQAGAAVLLGTAMVIDPWLSLLGALLGVGGYWRLQISRRRVEERVEEMRGQAAKSESLLQEALRVAPLSASYGLTEAPGASFETNLEVHAAAEQRANLSRALLGARAVALFFGGALVAFSVFCLSGRMPLSAGATIATALAGATLLALRLLSLRGRLDEADSAARELFAYLDRQSQLPQSKTPRELGELSHSLRIERVSLEDRHGRRVLDGATCEIPARQLTAVLSSDEESPAALARVAARLADPLEGQVLYDSDDLRGAELQQVRRRLVLVPARQMLFTGTAIENICCGESFEMDEVIETARRLKALEPLRALPQGLSTLVGPLGVDLSADAAFLIMLTRAALRRPSLLIVEEPADATSQTLDAVEAAAASHSVLLIPARQESLRRADRVILLHQGKVQQSGTHAELLKSSELYRHLNYIRFNPYQGNGSSSRSMAR